LLFIRRRHRIEADVPQRRQLGGRSHRSRHEPRPFLGRELLRHFPRQLRRFHVDLAHSIRQFKLAQHDARSAKRIRLDDVAADFEKVGVNLPNNVGTAQHQHFAAILFAPVIVQGRIARLNVRPHRAVIDNDALFHGL
jgi:hypothetical protein